MREVKTVLDWSDSFLSDMRQNAADCEIDMEYWGREISMISDVQLRAVGDVLCCAVQRHADLFEKLPPLIVHLGSDDHSMLSGANVESDVHAATLGASPSLWTALDPSLRKVLIEQ